MQKTSILLTGVIAGLLIAFLTSPLILRSASAQSSQGASYAEERALIENLQGRYLFAMDFKDLDTYASTFTPDGILDIGNGEIVGREAIKQAIANMPGGRHHITNIVLKLLMKSKAKKRL